VQLEKLKVCDKVLLLTPFAEQAWQLGDVAGYAPGFILSQHICSVGVIRFFAGIHACERLPIARCDMDDLKVLLVRLAKW